MRSANDRGTRDTAERSRNRLTVAACPCRHRTITASQYGSRSGVVAASVGPSHSGAVQTSTPMGGAHPAVTPVLEIDQRAILCVTSNHARQPSTML